MASPGGEVANEDSATEALILQMIAEDFGFPTQRDPFSAPPHSDHGLTGNRAPSNAVLDEDSGSQNDGDQSLDEDSLPDQYEQGSQDLTYPTSYQPQDLSSSNTPSHHDRTITADQTPNVNIGSAMPKRNVEAAGFPSFSDLPDSPSDLLLDDLLNLTTAAGSPANHAGVNNYPARARDGSGSGSQASTGTRRKRAKVDGSLPNSSWQEQPTHTDIAGSSQNANAYGHGSSSAQSYQPITNRSAFEPNMEEDRVPTQSSWDTFGAVTLSDRCSNNPLETAPPYMQSQHTSSDAPRAKASGFQEGRPQPTKVSHRPRDPKAIFGDNHKDHPNQPEGRHSGRHNQAPSNKPSSSNEMDPLNLGAIQDSGCRHQPSSNNPFGSDHKDHLIQQAAQSHRNAAKPARTYEPHLYDNSDDESVSPKNAYPSEALSPYDDDWHGHNFRIQALASRIATLARADARIPLQESIIRHGGKTWTYIEIPWPGKPGWVESYVDDTAYDDVNELMGGFGGRVRRRGPTREQMTRNQAKKKEEDMVDIVLGEKETLDSIVGDVVMREGRKGKGKGKAV